MGDFIRSLASVLAVLAFGIEAARAGSTLRLSDFSSDQTSAGDLDATLEFSVTGSTLTLTVTNDTPIGTGFDIADIFFNALPHVTGLSLNPAVEGWTIVLDERADGFGTFEFALMSDQGHHDPGEIGPQQTLDFEFDISGSGPFADADFTTQLSSIPPGNRPSLAAMKFVNGPGDDSAFGAVIPEPSTVALLLAGVGLLSRRSRRRTVQPSRAA